jgi:hypothetical protein
MAERVAVLGTRIMGAPMARNLLEGTPSSARSSGFASG